MRKHFLIIALACLPILVFSQEQSAPLKIGLGLNAISYQGDLIEKEGSSRRFNPGIGLSLQFAGEKPLHLQVNAGFGRFTEQTEEPFPSPDPEIVPNNFVSTSIFYLDGRLRYYILKDTKVRPFAGIGMGILVFNPKDAGGNFLGENIFTRLEGEDYLTTIVSFPIVTGTEINLSPILDLGIEYTYRLTTTDYLDNIGQLGPRPGNDGLHAFQLSLLFTLETNRR